MALGFEFGVFKRVLFHGQRPSSSVGCMNKGRGFEIEVFHLARIAASSPQRCDAASFLGRAILKYFGSQVIEFPCARTTAKSR
jgi:hypothetical protein